MKEQFSLKKDNEKLHSEVQHLKNFNKELKQEKRSTEMELMKEKTKSEQF